MRNHPRLRQIVMLQRRAWKIPYRQKAHPRLLLVFLTVVSCLRSLSVAHEQHRNHTPMSLLLQLLQLECVINEDKAAVGVRPRPVDTMVVRKLRYYPTGGTGGIRSQQIFNFLSHSALLL